MSAPTTQYVNEPPVVNMDSIKTTGEKSAGWHLFNNKITYVILGALVLAALGALGYFLLGGKEKEPAKPVSSISKVWMQQYFSIQTCNDELTCGDGADPDHDGLTNLEEFKVRKQTDPHNPDSDGDGLSDGDESHIYKTEPAAKFTSCTNNTGIACQYDDGSQVANDYDPLTPGLKMDDTRKQQIISDTATYKLHEPTQTTLKDKKIAASTTTESTAKTYNIVVEKGVVSPASLEIKVGDSVIWTNKDATTLEIASDPHPTHTTLPELHSAGLPKDGTYTFVFSKAGTFGYHNHLNPTLKGTVIVK